MKKTEANTTATATATEAKESERAKRTPAKEMAKRYIFHLKRIHKRPDIVKEILDAYSVIGVITAVDAFNLMNEYSAEFEEYTKNFPLPEI